MEDLTNIWNAGDDLNEEQLINYVKGKSTEEDTQAVERKMADSSFANDGIEGLQQFSSAEKIDAYVQQINDDLRYKLSDKKIKNKRGIKNNSWEIIAIIIIVLLCILAYVIITMMRK
ncbi:MAG: hypothetical protein ABI405_04175 [Parafilimonas sp.]